MDKLRKPSNSEYYAPSSESIRMYVDVPAVRRICDTIHSCCIRLVVMQHTIWYLWSDKYGLSRGSD
jgi:hypothetical protein